MLRVATALLLLSTPAFAGPLGLVSRADPARPSDTAGGPSRVAAVTPDGRYTVLVSAAANLLPGVTDLNGQNDFFLNDGSDLFLHDRTAGTTVLISHAAGDPATTADAPSGYASISADGRWAVFTSYAGNLVAGQIDPHPSLDVFLYDRITGAVTLVSHAAGSAVTAGSYCEVPVISADGSRIAFACSSRDLVPGQGENAPNIFLHDRASGATTVVSHLAGSTTAAGDVGQFALSADGNWVAFETYATGLVEGEVDNGTSDIYLYGHATSGIALVSHAAGAAATQADDSSYQPVISPDGGRVAYLSYAFNLVSGQVEENYTSDVFLYDRASGANVLVSHAANSTHTAGNSYSRDPSMSADGRWVAFGSDATNLIEGYSGWWGQVYLYDAEVGGNVLISRSAGSAAPANGSSREPQVSADGSCVVFRSEAPDLVAGQTDTAGSADLFLWTRASQTVALVTHAEGSPTTAARTTTAFYSTEDFRLGAGGGWIALTSMANDLTAGFDANAAEDVFLYERATGDHTLVSARGGEAPKSAGSSVDRWRGQALSHDGRFLAFQSLAPNLVAGTADDNNAHDVLLYDRQADGLTLVSHASGSPATAGDAESFGPLISADGSALLFLSRATDLVPGQAAAPPQLFHWDRASGAATRVAPAIAEQESYALSGDGRWAVFASYAEDLVPGQADANGGSDLFLWDRTTGAVALVSHAAGSPAQAGDAFSSKPAISSDGRWVVYHSYAADLVPGPVERGGLYFYDRTTGTNVRVTAVGDEPTISADGRWVAFSSRQTDVVPGQVDGNLGPDVFLWDRISGATLLASHTPASAAAAGNGTSGLPALSADGRWLVFHSSASNLVPGQTELLPNADVFLFDQLDGTLTLVSHAAGSPVTTGNGSSAFAVLSADGRFVAYQSYATDLVPGQIDGYSADQFLYDRTTGTASLITHAPGSEATSAGAGPERPHLSADGTWAVLESHSPDLVPGDLNGRPDLFLHATPLSRDFFTLAPCRIVDTRQRGPVLTSGLKRTFLAAGACGIPDTARAVAVNVTVVQPSGAGYLQLHAGDAAAPDTSAITFAAGAVRSNNAILALAFDGTGTLSVMPSLAGGGTVHVVLDVSGYFE